MMEKMIELITFIFTKNFGLWINQRCKFFLNNTFAD